MRFQISLEATIRTERTTINEHSATMEQTSQRIPRHEQDEDRWRYGYVSPGRDPVTEERGLGL
jgi:hypothetical protein